VWKALRTEQGSFRIDERQDADAFDVHGLRRPLDRFEEIIDISVVIPGDSDHGTLEHTNDLGEFLEVFFGIRDAGIFDKVAKNQDHIGSDEVIDPVDGFSQ